MKATVKLYSLEYREVQTYLMAVLFIAGNIIFPQPTWLPIYLFTLVGAYKYGWRVGLLTALASPCLNSLFFGMPAPAVLPSILLKSVLLAGAAGYMAHRFQRISIGMTAAVVLSYQVLGTLGEWLFTGDFYLAAQDFRIGIPGMLLQVFGGYFIIRYLIRR